MTKDMGVKPPHVTLDLQGSRPACYTIWAYITVAIVLDDLHNVDDHKR